MLFFALISLYFNWSSTSHIYNQSSFFNDRRWLRSTVDMATLRSRPSWIWTKHCQMEVNESRGFVIYLTNLNVCSSHTSLVDVRCFSKKIHVEMPPSLILDILDLRYRNFDVLMSYAYQVVNEGMVCWRNMNVWIRNWQNCKLIKILKCWG